MPVLEQRSVQKDPVSFRSGSEAQGALSNAIIPAVRGEYYSYSTVFTDEKPLYVLMKCRANKDRIIASAEELGSEANLLFRFDSTTHAQVCAIKTAHTWGLLGDSVNGELFGETWIAAAGITPEDFHKIRSQKNVNELVEISKAACSERKVFADLKPGAVMAMMTDAGKYGMFMVKEITPKSIHIDACHILL